MTALPAHAEQAEESPTVLGEVVVSEKKLITPTRQTNETVYTGSEITRKGLEAQGSRAAVSVYEAIKVLPGITMESADPYGLGAEQKNIRVRGVRGYLGAMTVAGVPNYGGNPIGPRDYLYDTENVDGIAVYKGAVPADLSTGVGSRGGAIELRPLWPSETFGFDLSQTFGTDSFSRTFMRLDTGRIEGIGPRMSLSYSYTDAEKWKGPGDLGPRHNFCMMLSQPTTGDDAIRLWFNYNGLEQNLYRPLTFAQVESLGDFYDLDYNDSLTGVKSNDINYYQYNRGDYLNRDILMLVPLTFSDTFRLTFRPYYSDESSEVLNGAASQGGIITQRGRYIERLGLITQFDAHYSWATASLGYWFETSDMVIRTQNYDPVTRAFRGYGMYMDSDDDGIVHSPFIKFSGTAGKIDWNAGLKYFHYTDPASQGYTSPPPDYAMVKADDLFRQENTYDEWLPSVGAAYRFTDAVEVYTSYGRSQIRPYAYVPIITLYNQNRDKFQAAGVTLDELFNGYDMELSDNFELGARFRWKRIEVMPAVYYAQHQNLLTTVYDPRVGLSYAQNIGDATGYGVDLETNFFITDNLTFFLNPAYTSLTYDDDLTYQGATLETEDKQVVDTPEWSFKTGLIFSYRDFELIPMVRYLGERYGDAEHKENIDDHFVADVKVGYTFRKLAFIDALKLSLELTNILDEEYVSVINSSDDTRAGSTSYHVGAPFSALLSVSFDM